MKSRALFLLFLILVSCNKQDEETLHIIILNETDVSIDITLYPKKDFWGESGDTYRFSDIRNVYRYTSFSLWRGNYMELFTSSNLDINPYVLAAKVFDSILISIPDKDVSIKFTHSSVTGYSENLFSEYSNWNFKSIRMCFTKPPRPDDCSRVHNVFMFEISEDKMTIE